MYIVTNRYNKEVWARTTVRKNFLRTEGGNCNRQLRTLKNSSSLLGGKKEKQDIALVQKIIASNINETFAQKKSQPLLSNLTKKSEIMEINFQNSEP